MRLLFDENLSPALPQLLSEIFPESVHVSELGLGGSADEAIWDFARASDYCIVTKDRDFARRSGHSLNCKVIWLRLGNCRTTDILQKIELCRGKIRYFMEDAQTGILEIF